MELLMIGHLLGDFYLQTDKMAKDKQESMKFLGLHGAIYALTIYLMIALSTGGKGISIIPALLVGSSHFIIDYVKIAFEKKYKMADEKQWMIFLIDQIIHLSVIVWVCCAYQITVNYTEISERLLGTAVYMTDILIYVAAILFCGKPAAVIVAMVFKAIPNTVEKAEQTEKGKNKKIEQVSAEVQEGLKIGSWIGILEREIILVLGFLGQYGAIGFVLTAKSLARYKQLENQAFAEKYLVGTLLSSLIALLCMAVCVSL